MENDELKFVLEPQEWDVENKKFLRELRFGHTGVAISREAFEKCGQFNPRYKVAGDYEHLLKIFNMDDQAFLYTRHEFFFMSYGGVSTSVAGRVIAYRESFQALFYQRKKVSFVLLARYFKAKILSVL